MTEKKQLQRQQGDIDKIAAMANPVRRRILDQLGVGGPATVGRLAERLGERVGSVSHHLKVLGAAGLVEEAPELAKDRRESWWRAVSISWTWSIADFADNPAGQVVAQAAEQESLRHSVERIQAWYATRDEYTEEWARAAYSSTSTLNATAGELADLTARLDEVVQEFVQATRDENPDRQPVFLVSYAVPVQP